MIVPEYKIREIVSTIPVIQVNPTYSAKPSFHWGDKFELNRYLKANTSPYPLIWLLPSKDDHIDRGASVNKACEFIIATRESRESLFNDQRYEKSFDVVLNPLFDHFIQGLKKSGFSRIISEWETFKYPNYSESDENVTIDLWDAITLNVSVNFTEDCLKTIIYT